MFILVYLFVCVCLCVRKNSRNMLENLLGIFRKRRRCDEPQLSTQPNMSYDTDNDEDEDDEKYAHSPEWPGAYISNLQIDR